MRYERLNWKGMSIYNVNMYKGPTIKMMNKVSRSISYLQFDKEIEKFLAIFGIVSPEILRHLLIKYALISILVSLPRLSTSTRRKAFPLCSDVSSKPEI
jgi:hypothetical protein